MFDEGKISFRKLLSEDLPLMQRWLSEPHVHEWYDKDKDNSLEEVAKRYDPKIIGNKPTAPHLVLYDIKPVAYIQNYKVNDYWEEFGQYVGYDDHTASVDLFIGEQDFVGRGFGSMMLKKFLKEIVFANPDITTCIIGPEPDNKRAIKAYEKVGFKYVKTVQIPDDPDLTDIMVIKREELSD
ncbi:MAG TPA: GNAT family N-acetyltransferase [Patescibacteria group bacterium]|nr:GNAT family N-acetyltransferase [Patescibacteria group bacterium]